jgi:glutaredoxin
MGDGQMGNCCSSDGCCPSTHDTGISRIVNVDFLYLDLSQCGWCQGTESNLDQAIAKVSDVLQATGVELKLNKVHVANEEQAQSLGFTTSPTIRVNGRDIQLDYKEAKCTACSDLCGDDVECRAWMYQGEQYTAPPEGMIIEAILRGVYGGSEESHSSCCRSKQDVPQNLKRFFRGINKRK